MRIGFNSFEQVCLNSNNDKNKKYYENYSNLAPLTKDTVSFGAMKKSQLQGIDLIVSNKFSREIPMADKNFNSNEDFQNWCKKKLENNYLSKDYSNINDEMKHRFQDWVCYCLTNNSFNNATALFIIDGISKNLKGDNAFIPELNTNVLNSTLSEITSISKNNPKFDCFNSLYETNLNKETMGVLENDNGEKIEGYTGWKIIKSKIHDEENFSENVKKLKILSYKTWCTGKDMAEPYLNDGDFHIYMENGRPKIGIRFLGDEIQEIQGEKNDGKIPVKYLDNVISHIKNQHLSTKSNDEVRIAIKIKSLLEQLNKPIEKMTAIEILEKFNMLEKQNENGSIILKNYSQPDEEFCWNDMGVDEKNLFKDVKEISGDADFTNSKLTNLGNLEKIGGNVYFGNSNIRSIGQLKEIDGDACFSYSWIRDLEKLDRIGGNALFNNSIVADLGRLKEIEGHALFSNSEVKDLGRLDKIGGNAIFSNSEVDNLGRLKKINGHAVFTNSKITDLGLLEQILGHAVFTNSMVNNLGRLKEISGSVYLQNSILNITDFNEIKTNGDIVLQIIE